MSTSINNASKKDVEELIAIYSSPHLYHSREEASWFVKSFFEYHHIKVLKNQGKVMGAIFWNVVEEKHHGLAEIRDLWILESFRRKGFGERLLRTAIEDMETFFKKQGFTLRKVMVTTGDDNEAAKRLYEKNRFEKAATMPDLFSKGETELIYVLTLVP